MEAEPYVAPLRNCLQDSWNWNPKARSPEVRLCTTTLRKALFHPGWSSGTAGVRGTKPLNQGRFFWELIISERVFGTSMMFGIGTKKARLHADTFTNLLGEDSNGWGLSHKGLLWHEGRWTHYTKPFRENTATKLGILFDGINGTLTYYRDHKCLGVAFRGLQKIEEPLYPIVCSTAARTEMCLGEMRRDFVNLQDRCRAVIAQRVSDVRHLQKLMLPTVIREYIAEAVVENALESKVYDENHNHMWEVHYM